VSSQIQISILTSGSAVTLSWDGMGDSGTIVTPGQYSIEVHWTNGQGAVADTIRQIMVMPSGGGRGMVVARPNELMVDKGIHQTTFDGTSITNSASLKANIYTVAGESITSVASPSGPPVVSWDASGMASGIYVVSTQVFDANGNMIHQQFLKVLVRH
jgi:flagellar hook assembly protein FlgD